MRNREAGSIAFERVSSFVSAPRNRFYWILCQDFTGHFQKIRDKMFSDSKKILMLFDLTKILRELRCSESPVLSQLCARAS